MKVKIFLVLYVLAFNHIINAQEIINNQLIVYGKIKVFAKADRARVVFNLKGLGESLKSAFADAKNKMNSISNQLDKIGIDNDDIATSFFRSSENYGDKAFFSSKRDYRAIMTVSVTIDSLYLLEPVVIALSENDIENIVNISFELINYSELKKKALKEAVTTAKEKADLVSKQLGIRYRDVLEFEEIKSREPSSRAINVDGYPTPYNAPFFARSAAQFGASESSLFSQKLTFESEVKLIFEIENEETQAE